ncbi:MAG: SDR family NAD(P)-dependent oxidoreductase, partial [Frankia sp.]
SATARRLVENGMHVVIFDQNTDRATEIAKELDGGATVAGGDVVSDEDVAAAIDAAVAAGPLSVVVNVAGGGVGGGRTVTRDGRPHDKESFVKTVEMNVVTTFNMTRLAGAAMSRNEPDEDGQRGVVVNTASIAGLEGQTGQVAYGAAKAAIVGMTLPMARDLAPLGIRVCSISPGTMGTPLMLSVSEEVRSRLVKDIVFPSRMGRPEEFALLVESIVRNPYLNGENIRLDGALRFPPK